MFDTVIIGAGVAGTAAAEALQRADVPALVLDKGRAPGGRCATRRSAPAEDAPWFDFGAQYFTARDPVFRDAVEADLAAGRLVHWQPATAQAERDDKRWRLTASPDERERLIGPAGLKRWVGERLAASGAELRAGVRATALRPAEHGWTIDIDGAEPIAARRLIVTAPAPQATALLGAQANRLASLAMADTALAPCLSAVVEAPARAGAQAVFVKNGRLSWFADNGHKAANDHDRRLWTLHAGTDFSADWLEADPDRAAAELIDEFAAITSQATADLRLVYSHRWRYARPGEGAPPAERCCEAHPERGLALAGDWLAGGRIEGAWLSGRAAARRLLTIDAT